MNRIFSVIAVVCLLSLSGFSQSAELVPDFVPTFHNANGSGPAALGFVCSYAAGSTTPADTYQDSALSTLNQNPIRLSAGGRPINGSTLVSIYMTPDVGSYRFILYANGTGNTCNGTTVGAVIRSADNIYSLAQLFLSAFATKMDDKVCHAAPQAGATAGAKIAACITALPSTGGTIDARGLEGAQTISSTLTLGANQFLLLGAGTYTLSGASIAMSTGSGIIGIGPCRTLGDCTTLKRTTGTTSMITATGISGTHVNNFTLANFYLDGGNTAGHGIVLDYVDGFRIDNVVAQNGGAANALRLLNEAWDFWVTNSAFVIWGSAAVPTVQISGLNGGAQITDGHWTANQFGEVGNGNIIMVSNAFVLQQRFIDNKFHTTGGAMPYMIDWSGYRSDFIGCTFQADTASATGGMVRIKNAQNSIIGGGFNDVTNGDAIHVVGPNAGVNITGVRFVGTGAPSPGSAVVAEATVTGKIIVSGNEITNMAKGYDFSTGSGVRSIGPSMFSGVTTEVDATGVGTTWIDFYNGKSTATFGGTNLPTARSAATLNPVLRLGGNAATNSSGYQGLYLLPAFTGAGQINELIGMGTGWLSGIGTVSGTNIEHPIGWCYDGDVDCLGIYAKPTATPVAAGHKVFTLNRNGSVTYVDTNGGFAGLGAGPQTAGTVRYCSDCNPNTVPCTGGGGTGAIAKRLNGAWDCR